jgi:hypothetical protein
MREGCVDRRSIDRTLTYLASSFDRSRSTRGSLLAASQIDLAIDDVEKDFDR